MRTGRSGHFDARMQCRANIERNANKYPADCFVVRIFFDDFFIACIVVIVIGCSSDENVKRIIIKRRACKFCRLDDLSS